LRRAFDLKKLFSFVLSFELWQKKGHVCNGFAKAVQARFPLARE
jgi:hypothetical protein